MSLAVDKMPPAPLFVCIIDSENQKGMRRPVSDQDCDKLPDCIAKFLDMNVPCIWSGEKIRSYAKELKDFPEYISKMYASVIYI